MYSTVLLTLGGTDMLVIMIIALLLFGGDKLPEIAKGLGKGIRDFKEASEGVKREINNQINSYEEKKAEAAANTTTIALPPATDHATSVTEESTTTNNTEHNTTVPEVSNVPNTMPYVENHTPASDEHVTAEHNGTSTTATDAKNEPVKTNNV